MGHPDGVGCAGAIDWRRDRAACANVLDASGPWTRRGRRRGAALSPTDVGSSLRLLCSVHITRTRAGPSRRRQSSTLQARREGDNRSRWATGTAWTRTRARRHGAASRTNSGNVQHRFSPRTLSRRNVQILDIAKNITFCPTLRATSIFYVPHIVNIVHRDILKPVRGLEPCPYI